MTKTDKILLVAICILAVIAASVVLSLTSCKPRPIAWPISESHSQITATEYDLAEAEFSGGLAPMSEEWAAVQCQKLLDKRDNLSAVQIAVCATTGGTGFGTLMPKDVTPEERKKWDISLGALTLAFGVTCTTLAAVVKNLSARFEAECATKPAPEPEPVEHPASDEVEPDGGVL